MSPDHSCETAGLIPDSRTRLETHSCMVHRFQQLTYIYCTYSHGNIKLQQNAKSPAIDHEVSPLQASALLRIITPFLDLQNTWQHPEFNIAKGQYVQQISHITCFTAWHSTSPRCVPRTVPQEKPLATFSPHLLRRDFFGLYAVYTDFYKPWIIAVGETS